MGCDPELPIDVIAYSGRSVTIFKNPASARAAIIPLSRNLSPSQYPTYRYFSQRKLTAFPMI
jgi:hypothetical protein